MGSLARGEEGRHDSKQRKQRKHAPRAWPREKAVVRNRPQATAGRPPHMYKWLMVNRISRQYHYAECATVTVVTVLACAKISRERSCRVYIVQVHQVQDLIETCATIVQSLWEVLSKPSHVPWRTGVAAAPKFCGGSECDNKRARSARSRTGRRPRGGGDGSALSTNELRASALRASSLPLGCFCRACN